MPDPTSWYAIEPGWVVRGADGAVIGTVSDVLGDEELDIFHGLVASFWVGTREVPAEMVTGISTGQIELRIGANDVRGLVKSQ